MLRVAFAGTPEFAAVALRAILAAGYPVPLVLTQPDRPAGRGMRLAESPVKEAALAEGLAVDQPDRLRSEAQRAALARCAPDVLVVAAYGLILPAEVLALPRLGCINIHASLLPRWRGAAPIQRAIEAGDAESGITIMQMDAGLDTGPILMREALPIGPQENAGQLHDRLAALGGEMVVAALRRLADGELAATPQPADGVTYAHKIDKTEAVLDWRLPAQACARRVRAYNPFPGAQARLRGQTVKIWAARAEPGHGEPGRVLAADRAGVVVACGDGALRCLELQRAGARRMSAGEFLGGFEVTAEDRFEVAGGY